jgi:hypothetical protein
MTLNELLKQLGIHLDECTSNEEIGEYVLDLKQFDERDDDPYNILSIEINNIHKTITFKDYKEIKENG